MEPQREPARLDASTPRPKRKCTLPKEAQPPTPATAPRLRVVPKGRVLVIHANSKEYGTGAGGSKASNREFSFSARDYLQMRDSGVPYSGNPKTNPLLPLPRPTYTEFVNRAKLARMPDRLDFLYCPADAVQPPPWRNFAAYERVVWCGVSFRRFARIWTPERHHFFQPTFQRRVIAVLCCARRARSQGTARHLLGALPDDILHDIIAASAERADSRRGLSESVP